MRGRVKLFSLERGYGFIKPDNGGPDVYVTRVNVDKPKGLLRPGDLVSFRIRQKGQPQAVQVVKLNEDGTEDDSGAWRWWYCGEMGWGRGRGSWSGFPLLAAGRRWSQSKPWVCGRERIQPLRPSPSPVLDALAPGPLR